MGCFESREGFILFALKLYGVGGYIAKLGRISLPEMFTLPKTADIFSIDYSVRAIRTLNIMDIINQYNFKLHIPINNK